MAARRLQRPRVLPAAAEALRRARIQARAEDNRTQLKLAHAKGLRAWKYEGRWVHGKVSETDGCRAHLSHVNSLWLAARRVLSRPAADLPALAPGTALSDKPAVAFCLSIDAPPPFLSLHRGASGRLRWSARPPPRRR